MAGGGEGRGKGSLGTLIPRHPLEVQVRNNILVISLRTRLSFSSFTFIIVGPVDLRPMKLWFPLLKDCHHGSAPVYYESEFSDYFTSAVHDLFLVNCRDFLSNCVGDGTVSTKDAHEFLDKLASKYW